MIAKTAAMLEQASATYPTVSFRYCTAVEAMQRWQGIPNQAPPQLNVQETEPGPSVTLSITTDKAIFQAKPFVVVRDAYRRYSNVSSLCTPAGSNSWSIRLPTARANLAKIGIAVTDVYGNSATRLLHYLPDDFYLDNLDPQYSEPLGTWASTTNAAWGTDARVALLGSNGTAQVLWSLPISTSGQYSIAAQIPSLTNACTNVTFRLLAGESNICSVAFPTGLQPNQWNFLFSTFLDQGATNRLEMTAHSNDRQETYAVADVISIVPIVPCPGAPRMDRISITPLPQQILVQFEAEPGSKCSVERSTNLVANWTTLDVLAVPLTGLLEYEDHNPPEGAAYYRVTRISQLP